MPDLGNPMTGGFIRRIPPSASNDVQIAALNEIIDRLNNNLQTQAFSDGTTRRMLIGFQANGWGTGQDFGIKVSIPGVDVVLATDDQLLFKMDLATWFFYDPTTHKNFMQLGIMPDGDGGFAVAGENKNVEDLFV